ncbi:MAG TPA: hypothetical protein VEV41_06930 [Terriglobales bacterium]|jgi:hypothetical protein|nr:hypothetical protein [Terriglobales bacterium]
MKRIAFVVVAVVCTGPLLMAQAPSGANGGDRFEAGVFADYFILSRPGPHINFVGVGARAGFNMGSRFQLEGEMSYDFKRNFNNAFSNGFTTSLATTEVRPLHGLVGPKFNEKLGPVRAFVTFKVGFLNFSSSTKNAPAGFTSALGAITTGDTRLAMYPGIGVESFWGPIGLRLDGGDDIYFDKGMRHNIKASFGPVIRF